MDTVCTAEMVVIIITITDLFCPMEAYKNSEK